MTWRKNTTHEEVQELRRFVEDMKRGVTPVTGDSLVETLRQIHDRREAESPRPEHRQILLERLRRQMAERDGAEPEPEPGCEVVFLPPRKPRIGLGWAVAASLVVHVAIGGIVLPNVRFNPMDVAEVLTPAEDDDLELVGSWVPIAPIGGPDVVGDTARSAEQFPVADRRSLETGQPGSPDSRVQSAATVQPVSLRVPTRPAQASQPVAPAQVNPLLRSFVPEGMAESGLDDGPSPELDGPPEPASAQPGVPSTFTEVLAATAAVDVDTQPRVLTKPRPVYTSDALEDNVQGFVLVSALFGADGLIRDVRVLRGLGHGLDEAAVRAVSQIKFIPATRSGVPVGVTRTIKVGFSLR
jgi:protein TonB